MGKSSKKTKTTTPTTVTPLKVDLAAFKKTAAPAKPLPNLPTPSVANTLTDEEKREIIKQKLETARLAALLLATPESTVTAATSDFTMEAADRLFAQEERAKFVAEPSYSPADKTFSKNHAGGGSKGKEGNSDHTAGKCQFARPCTVGWKSQNQPLQRGGGGRTPRMKSPAVAK